MTTQHTTASRATGRASHYGSVNRSSVDRCQSPDGRHRVAPIIVGAGSAGLAVAAELSRRGIVATVLEESDALGAAWRSRYDHLRLNSTKGVSALPGARWPSGTPAFPTRDDLVAYLDAYAVRHGLDIQFEMRVGRVDRDGKEWIVHAGGAQLRTRWLVIATGQSRVPFIPAWPGLHEFDGRLLHAAQYRNPNGLRGRDVLVIGAGSSGMEIAYDLAQGGAARVRVAVRTPPNLLLRSPVGPTIAKALYHLPVDLADGLTRAVRRREIGDLSAFGLPVPEEGMFRRLRRLGVVPTIVDREVIEAIRRRRIETVGAVVAFGARDVELADGQRIAPGVVIAATGYRTGLEAIVGHLGVLDAYGMPRVHAGEAAPGLRFIGFDHRPAQLGYGGRQGASAARAIAKATRERRDPDPDTKDRDAASTRNRLS